MCQRRSWWRTWSGGGGGGGGGRGGGGGGGGGGGACWGGEEGGGGGGRGWREMGRAPGESVLARRGSYSISAYKKRWGSVKLACAAVAAFHAGRVSREELLEGRGERPGPVIGVDQRMRVMKRDRFRCT